MMAWYRYRDDIRAIFTVFPLIKKFDAEFQRRIEPAWQSEVEVSSECVPMLDVEVYTGPTDQIGVRVQTRPFLKPSINSLDGPKLSPQRNAPLAPCLCAQARGIVESPGRCF